MDSHYKYIRQLFHSGTFNGQAIRGKLIETHISWVIITDKYAFKIKKGLKLPFLDYSSLQKRESGCRKEVELNSRYTDIYLKVVPIKKAGEHLFIGEGKGEIIDFAVQMKKLQEAKKMDNQLANNRVDTSQIKLLAQKIAFFHQSAPTINTPFNLQKAQLDFNDIQKQTSWIKKHLGVGYFDKVHQSIRYSNDFLNEHSSLFEKRIYAGYQRDLHGDLHCGNIFLYKEPVLFDCIEFNTTFRQIDILNEIAFLTMDLEVRGFPDFSLYFTQCYFQEFPLTASDDTLQLLNYYKCYRANIRAKVHCIRAQQLGSTEALNLALQNVNKYLDWMYLYSQKY